MVSQRQSKTQVADNVRAETSTTDGYSSLYRAKPRERLRHWRGGERAGRGGGRRGGGEVARLSTRGSPGRDPGIRGVVLPVPTEVLFKPPTSGVHW